jgi:hypothetical protein
MLQRIYATFAKYIGLAEYVKHENTQDTVRVLVRIPRTLIDVKGEAWPYQVLELLLTWQYYIWVNPNPNLAALFTLIINLFHLIYHDIMIPYDFYCCLILAQSLRQLFHF